MASERIVIIDDDPDVCEALSLILTPQGYKVSTFSSGPAGMAAIRADPPDLLILDIMLASPSEGFHLAHELRGDEQFKRLPIIMISAIGQTMGMDYAKELGIDSMPAEMFLEKPLKAATVLSGVRQTLATSRGRDTWCRFN